MPVKGADSFFFKLHRYAWRRRVIGPRNWRIQRDRNNGKPKQIRTVELVRLFKSSVSQTGH